MLEEVGLFPLCRLYPSRLVPKEISNTVRDRAPAPRAVSGISVVAGIMMLAKRTSRTRSLLASSGVTGVSPAVLDSICGLRLCMMRIDR